MAITLNPATKVFSVLQSDLSFVSGTLWDFDTDVQRKAMWDLLSSEPYIWMDEAFIHNTEVTDAGVTYARTLEMINGYSITLEDTGSAYTANFVGSNNNFFDIENSILNPTPLVTIQSNNSAGLQTVVSGSGVTPGDVTDIKNAIFDEIMENSESFADQTRLIRADAAGSIRKAGDVHRVRNAADDKDRITATATAADRDVTATDGT